MKAVVGGVTAIQGSPPVTRTFPGWMLRNVEKEEFGHGQSIFQSVLLATGEQLDATAKRLADGKAFIYHLAEGIDPVLRSEFELLDDHGCVRDGLIGIHSTALADDDFARWKGQGGGAIVWSPFSNLWLYGGTTDVVSARKRGLRVCLGSDWTPSGTRNVLGELKVAQRWNRTALDSAFDPEELVEMVTANPGDTLARPWGAPVGRLVEGALADLACFTAVHDDPWRTVLAATERNVRLVIVGGRPVYGNRSLLVRAGAKSAESITVAGVRRAIVMDLPEELLPEEPDVRAEATKSWKDGLAELAAVWDDPGGGGAEGAQPARPAAARVRSRHARSGRRRGARARRRRARPARDADRSTASATPRPGSSNSAAAAPPTPPSSRTSTKNSTSNQPQRRNCPCVDRP